MPSENIVIRRCTMRDGHGGVVIGSEMSADVRNIFVEDCQMDSPNLDRVLRIKTNSVRGGVVENIFMRRVSVGEVADAILKIDLFYEEGDVGMFAPAVRRIDISNVVSRRSQYAVWIRGYERSPVRGVRISRCEFRDVASPNVLEHVDGLTLDSVRVEYRGTPAPAR